MKRLHGKCCSKLAFRDVKPTLIPSSMLASSYIPSFPPKRLHDVPSHTIYMREIRTEVVSDLL